MKVAEFLKNHQVDFEMMSHARTFEAQRMAHELHVSGREVAKTVLLKRDDGSSFVVAVLPANTSVDLDRASQLVGVSGLQLASENEVSQQCPDCETGALPPFGSQYEMKTIVDDRLADEDEIVFEANTHEEAVRMKFADFRQLEQPLVGNFAI